MNDASLTLRVEALCQALGYLGSATYFDSSEAFDRSENVHVVLTAFRAIGIHSVFGLSDGAVPGSFKPVVYVGVAADAAGADDLHRRTWTQGVVPLLILVTPRGVEVRNAFGPPIEGLARIPLDEIGEALPAILEDVSARSLTTSIHWKDRKVSRDEAIDTRLVTAIERMNLHACAEYPELDTREGRALVNALVGRLIYLYVLVDRGLVGEAWLRNAIEDAGCAGSLFAGAAVLKGVRVDHPDFSAAEVWAALDGIDAAINGCVFPIARKDRARIPDELVRFVHSVVRWGETVAGRQLSFLDVSFQVLRTETISAIYERFLRVEDGDAQRAEGAFYTPPYLADFVVARADAQRPIDGGSRVVDAAAGSGVFLVSAYRRIMERCAPNGGWGPDHASAARSLLQDCIFGIERNPQAANVCRFSLYLTMLDYVAGVDIGRLGAIEDGGKLLPSLDSNVVVASAFTHPFGKARFTHVVGNPPWLRLKRRGARRNGPVSIPAAPAATDDSALTAFLAELGGETPVVHGRLSDAFVWLAVECLAAEDAVIGLILPTTSLVGRQSERFASALATRVSVRTVANLSYLRYRLFAGARAPATIVVAGRHPSRPSDPVTVYRPRLSSLPLGAFGDVWALMVSQTDLHTAHVRDLQGDANGWFAPLVLGTVDRRTRDALRTLTGQRKATVAGFFERSRLRILRGGNAEETGFAFPKRIDRQGREVTQNLVRLASRPGPEITNAYRALFSGNVLLVPCTFKNLRVLQDPHAFNSTFYGILFDDLTTNSDSTTRDDAFRPLTSAEKLRGLHSLRAFLDSGVVRYFAALYGATVLLDGARFEKGDLLALPCPFGSVADPAFQFLFEAQDVDAAILDALGAGPDLRQAVEEFLYFSQGYADAQIPPDAFKEAGEADIRIYMERLQRELAASFTERFRPTATVVGTGGGLVSIRISFGRKDVHEAYDRTEPDGTFVASSVVSFDRKAGIAMLRKSSALFAWMSDQAVEDAGELVRQVASGGA